MAATRQSGSIRPAPLAVAREAAPPSATRVREVSGPVRLGRRTKVLVRRLLAGEVAVIDHLDIDRVSAEELIAGGAAAVLNCRPSTSGTYPNLGPQLLVEAGVLLVDLADDALFRSLSDGDPVTVRVTERGAAAQRGVAGGSGAAGGPGAGGGAAENAAAEGGGAEVLFRGQPLARGVVLDLARVRADTEARKREIGEALERFAHNTIEHMREERELLAGRIDLPRFRTDFRDRPALVVVRGVDRRHDLRALRPFIRDTRPLLLAVDGGADALREAGLRADMIVGDMDSASEDALLAAREGRTELVVHCYPDGCAPGRQRLERLGLPFKLVPAPGTSQDVAMLIAAEKGARLIVSVGAHFNLVEFLDRAREGMSSTFLTRLRVGEILVDAKGVSRLYRPMPGLAPLVTVIGAGVAALVAVVWTTPALRDVASLLWLKLRLLFG